MAGGAIAERAKLSLLVARRGMRRLRAGINGHPLLRWRFSSPKTDRLLIAPHDLRTADPTRAAEIYGGRFAFAGKVVTTDGRSPFEIAPPSAEWAEALASFGWLRHLRAAATEAARLNARRLVDEWIKDTAPGDPVSWRVDIVARRLLAWLAHAPFLLEGADVRFYRRFIRSLTRHVRFLRGTAPSLPDGLPRLQAVIALAYAALCMAGQARLLKPVTKELSAELARQILPDGGHVSRNPGALIELLLDLLPMRQAFGARDMPPPTALLHAIDRMMPMLRFFRHGDGGFASFNGMGPTPLDLLATVLAFDDARGRPVANAAHSGYQRIEANGTVVILDTGRPPPPPVSCEAHAGCLAFELSARRHRIVVNCGLPAVGRDSWRHFARTTPAHSSVSVNDASSCRFLASFRLQRVVGSLVVDGPTAVAVERDEDRECLRLRASHDGYAAPFALLHERVLTLAADGRRLDGEDTLRPSFDGALPRNVPDAFAIRFHLHPGVRATPLTHRHGVMLTLPNREVWTFEAYDHEVGIEASVYLAGHEGPRRTTQLAIHGHARTMPRVAWSFVQLATN